MTRVITTQIIMTPRAIAERNAAAKMAEHEWKPIFDAVSRYISQQPARDGALAQYNNAIFHRIHLTLKRDMLLETLGHTESVRLEAAAERERLLDFVKQGKTREMVNSLKSIASEHSSLINKHLLHTEAEVVATSEIASVAELSSEETVAINTSVAVENKVASRVLSLIKAGGPFMAGLTAAEVIVAAKIWLDQLPDTQPISAEMATLKDYVEKNGPDKANNFQMNLYLHDAEPTR